MDKYVMRSQSTANCSAIRHHPDGNCLFSFIPHSPPFPQHGNTYYAPTIKGPKRLCDVLFNQTAIRYSTVRALSCPLHVYNNNA